MNVTALVAASDGAVVERYMYDPYGKVLVRHGVRDAQGNPTTEWQERTSNIFENQILFCGYRRDPETNLFHVRRRYYHATLGRWLSRDPAGYTDGMNLYEYCRSGPVAASDPSGLDGTDLRAWVEKTTSASYAFSYDLLNETSYDLFNETVTFGLPAVATASAPEPQGTEWWLRFLLGYAAAGGDSVIMRQTPLGFGLRVGAKSALGRITGESTLWEELEKDCLGPAGMRAKWYASIFWNLRQGGASFGEAARGVGMLAGKEVLYGYVTSNEYVQPILEAHAYIRAGATPFETVAYPTMRRIPMLNVAFPLGEAISGAGLAPYNYGQTLTPEARGAPAYQAVEYFTLVGLYAGGRVVAARGTAATNVAPCGSFASMMEPAEAARYQAYWKNLTKPAPVQALPYQIIPRYTMEGAVKSYTTYDRLGFRAYTYEFGPSVRHGPGYHIFEQSAPYGAGGKGPRSAHIPFDRE